MIKQFERLIRVAFRTFQALIVQRSPLVLSNARKIACLRVGAFMFVGRYSYGYSLQTRFS